MKWNKRTITKTFKKVDKMNEMDKKVIRNLQERVEKLEKEIRNSKRKELDWALNQFRYIEKTSDQSKALMIIEKELGFKKTSLRPKPVK